MIKLFKTNVEVTIHVDSEHPRRCFNCSWLNIKLDSCRLFSNHVLDLEISENGDFHYSRCQECLYYFKEA